jgi:hypothetical protein
MTANVGAVRCGDTETIGERRGITLIGQGDPGIITIHLGYRQGTFDSPETNYQS